MPRLEQRHTYFYDQGGIAGHAVLFAYNQQTGDSAIESFGPKVHAPIWAGESMFEMGSITSADDLRAKFSSLTIQTSPELAQQVIDYIRANPDPSTWTAIGPNCSTQVWKILQKFKLAQAHGTDNSKDPGAFPSGIWRNLTAQYNPNASQTPKNGTDYGNARHRPYLPPAMNFPNRQAIESQFASQLQAAGTRALLEAKNSLRLERLKASAQQPPPSAPTRVMPTPAVTHNYNVIGPNARMNLNSTDNSSNVVQFNVRELLDGIVSLSREHGTPEMETAADEAKAAYPDKKLTATKLAAWVSLAAQSAHIMHQATPYLRDIYHWLSQQL